MAAVPHKGFLAEFLSVGDQLVNNSRISQG
jgi:hypothetical protein